MAEGEPPARENFALRSSERWQPPAFRSPRTRRDRLLAAGRRLLDLQAASAWRDLKVELATAHGDVLDVGAGAQPYRPLLPSGARYRAIDVAVAGEAFGYDVADTEYFEGDRWPSFPTPSTSRATAGRSPTPRSTSCSRPRRSSTCPSPSVFLAEARRVLRPGGA